MAKSSMKTPPEVVEGIKKEWGQNFERVPKGPSQSEDPGNGSSAGGCILLIIAIIVVIALAKAFGVF